MLNYQTVGNPKKPPILFLHGFLGSGKDWIKIANSFRDDYFCILPDLPGHGKNPSEIPENVNSFEFVANQIVSLLDSLKLEKANLIGYSMGGRLVLFTASEYQSRFLSLTLEGVNPGLETLGEIKTRKRWENEIISLLNHSPFSEFLKEWYKMSIFRSLHNNPTQLKEMMKERVQNDPGYLAGVFEKLALSKQPNLWNKFKKLKLPTLLVSGSLDEKYMTINSRTVQKMQSCTHNIIENSGHNTHFEEPDKFIRSITNFLKINLSS